MSGKYPQARHSHHHAWSLRPLLKRGSHGLQGFDSSRTKTWKVALEMPNMRGGLEGPELDLAPSEALSVPDRFPLESAIENDEVQNLPPQRLEVSISRVPAAEGTNNGVHQGRPLRGRSRARICATFS